MRISDGELKKLLVESGKVKPTVLKEIEDQNTSKEPLMAMILKRKLLSEKELTQLYAASIDVPFIELGDIKIPHEVLTKIPARIAKKYQAVVFDIKDGKLQLAMADPEDFQAADFIEKQTGGAVKIFAAVAGDIAAALDQYQGSMNDEISQAIKASSSDEEEKTAEVSAKDLAEDAPIAKTVNIMLEYALRSRASDIHIEPRENVVQVRYRVDGVLKDAMTLPKQILPAVVSRIKILANLKIDEHRVPQDGRFKFSLGSKAVALRVSTLPIMDGEKVVMRLLDESTKAMTLEELGFEGNALEIIKNNIHKPHGMVLATGPTGSGKSTTLYSILNILNTPGVNISTVEDPVEYRIMGVNQTQVNPKAGMTFAGGLRALLRQDPNIIMVGEIRDAETADLAVQAALTGHIVLSTLHTNNAATALPRLLDMKIEPFLIASTVNVVLAQRLVRRLCPVCRVPYSPDAAQLEDLKKDFQVDTSLAYFRSKGSAPAAPAATAKEPAKKASSDGRSHKVIQPEHAIELDKSILDKIASDPNIINRSAIEADKAKSKGATVIADKAPKAAKTAGAGDIQLYKVGPGCGECSGGYLSRIGIHEVLEVTETIARLITNRATSEEIQLQAVKEGMLTMQQDGFVKALEGLTTIEEIMRVTRE